MHHLTPDILERAVRLLPADTFDSHDLIRALYTHFQHEYLAELTRNQSAPYPFTETHRQIGLALSRMTGLVERRGRTESKNIRGEDSPNQRWFRL